MNGYPESAGIRQPVQPVLVLENPVDFFSKFKYIKTYMLMYVLSVRSLTINAWVFITEKEKKDDEDDDGTDAISKRLKQDVVG